MKELVLHHLDTAAVNSLLDSPPQSLIVSGQTGIGKSSFVTNFISQLLGIPAERVATSADVRHIDQSTSELNGIEQAKEIKHFLSLKPVRRYNTVHRVVWVENGELLSREAQNALLKTLEEPPKGTLLILSVPSEHELLPTITSRCQVLRLHKPDATALTQYLTSNGYDPERVEQSVRLSGGLPGLTASLLQDSADHPFNKAITLAKDLLASSSFERLTAVNQLAKQRGEAMQICLALEQIAHSALQMCALQQLARWRQILAAALDCRQSLEARANVKLALTKLMLSI